MADHGVESGLELVLDNRKLIIFFLILITIIGGFFVLGFIEGKRQGYREGAQAAALAPSSDSEAAPRSEGAADEPESDPLSRSAGSEDPAMDWYKNAGRLDQEAAMKAPSMKKAEEPSKKPSFDKPAGYSVQVGAFRQKQDAEVEAQLLKSKGFDSRIEPPQAPGQLYLLKVGKFSSRSDAVAMQIRLKNSGFKCFIKTN